MDHNTADKTKGIIILHGIMGSQLFAAEDIRDKKDKLKFEKNERLWIYNPLMDGCFKISWNLDKSLLPDVDNRFEEDDRIEALACDVFGRSVNPITTAGINDKQFGDYGKDGEYGATNLYTDIVVKLKSVFGEENAVFLNYDWRRSVKLAAEDLKNDIDGIAQKYDTVYIVAHSMGGLVALEYIKNCGNAKKIRLITLGTPFFGAPEALYILNTGKALPINFGMKGILKIVKNVGAAYDLLPTADYLKNSSYLTKRTKNLQFTYMTAQPVHLISDSSETLDESATEQFLKSDDNGLNGYLLGKSSAFHKNLNSLETFNNMEYSCALVGYGKPTMTEVTVENTSFYSANSFFGNKLLKNEINYSGKLTDDGDGTVPLISATMGGGIKKDKLVYIKEGHAGLVTGSDAIAFVLDKINDWGRAHLVV